MAAIAKTPPQQKSFAEINTKSHIPSNEKLSINKNPRIPTKKIFVNCDTFLSFFTKPEEVKKILSVDSKICKKECSKTILRLSILGKNGHFRIPINENDEDIKIFPSSFKQSFFSGSKSSDGFVLLEGKLKSVENYLKQELFFCPTLGITSSLEIAKYQFQPPEKTKTKVNNNKKALIESPLITKTLYMIKNVEKEENLQMTPNIFFLTTSERDIKSARESKVDSSNSWGNLKINIHNIMENNEDLIKDVKITLYSGVHQTCQTITDSPEYIAYTGAKGDLTLFNVLVKEYTVQIYKKGFKIGCENLNNLFNAKGDQTKFTIFNTFIIPDNEIKNKGSLMYALFWANSANLQLQSTFELGKDSQTCRVGFFNENNCEMKFTHKKIGKEAKLQTILINKLANYEYLFFVQNIPTSKKGKENFELLSSSDPETAGKGNNEIALNSQAKVYVFSHDSQTPVGIYNLPSAGSREKTEINLIWLVGCLNGKIGENTQKSIENFWMKPVNEKDKKYYNKNKNDKNLTPSANICNELYKKK